MVGKKGSINETAEMMAEIKGNKVCARLVRDYLEKKSYEEELVKTISSLRQKISSLRPSCPVCLETMAPPVRIFTCGNGHLICSTCQPRVVLGKCYCKARYMGKATAVEQMLSDMQDM